MSQTFDDSSSSFARNGTHDRNVAPSSSHDMNVAESRKRRNSSLETSVSLKPAVEKKKKKTQISQLAQSANVHSNASEQNGECKKKHACNFPGCGKRFRRRDVLMDHKNTHTGSKPYQCETCPIKFATKPSLQKHQPPCRKKCSGNTVIRFASKTSLNSEPFLNERIREPPSPQPSNVEEAASHTIDVVTVEDTLPPTSPLRERKSIIPKDFNLFAPVLGEQCQPSGVAVNTQGDIVVADTNNHRIQVFDKEGRFKFQFGECGKRDGQLLYPNRVSVNKMTGDFVVTERSPTHQIQVYNQYGQFLCKFGADNIQHPREVCVDTKGRIIVIDSKVMRVIIFDMFGNILQKFSCSRYLEFPNGICTNDKNEILISDNRAHCIKVFSYEGEFLRQIGGEGVTNNPIGVGINSMGDVVVAHNHNNFSLTVFSENGNMIGALESKVKHAQCFDVALVDDGSVVLASKDYRLYLYRFNQGSQ